TQDAPESKSRVEKPEGREGELQGPCPPRRLPCDAEPLPAPHGQEDGQRQREDREQDDEGGEPDGTHSRTGDRGEPSLERLDHGGRIMPDPRATRTSPSHPLRR